MSDSDPRGDGPNEDPLPALLAEIDQALMMIPQVVRLARGNFDGFMAEEFTERQALYLTAVQLTSNPGNAPS